jgi:hypothetical protein
MRHLAFASIVAMGLGGLAVYAWQTYDAGSLLPRAFLRTPPSVLTGWSWAHAIANLK